MTDEQTKRHCRRCKYDLNEAPVIDGEVLCPECGSRGLLAEVTTTQRAEDQAMTTAWTIAVAPPAATTLMCVILTVAGRSTGLRDLQFAAFVAGCTMLALVPLAPLAASAWLWSKLRVYRRRLVTVLGFFGSTVFVNVLVMCIFGALLGIGIDA